MSRLRGGEDWPEELPLGADSSGERRRGVKSRNQVDAADPRVHLYFGSEHKTNKCSTLAVALFSKHTHLHRDSSCAVTYEA